MAGLFVLMLRVQGSSNSSLFVEGANQTITGHLVDGVHGELTMPIREALCKQLIDRMEVHFSRSGR